MRRFTSLLLGSLAAALGLMIALPTITYSNSVWVIQMLLSEFSWFPALLGTFAVGLGALPRRKSGWGVLLGAFGAFWSLVPMWQIKQATELNEAAMRDGLGVGYTRRIPPHMLARIAQSRWSLEGSGMTRYRTNHVQVEQDLVFHATPQRPLKLDIYRPTLPPVVGDRYPAIIAVHGGAWRYGDKGEVFTAHNRYLANLGYVVFDVQYRLSDEARWREPLDDVRVAVRWVKRYAPAYQVDPSRVALLGRSSGGHLALLAAYSAKDDLDKVAAVVAMYPPTDLRLWISMEGSEVAHFMGGTARTAHLAYAESSVLDLVRDGLPPTLIAQGYRDDLVAPAHAELLHNKLQATDTPIVTLRLPWSRHGFDAIMTGLGAQVVQYDMDRFLAWALYGG